MWVLSKKTSFLRLRILTKKKCVGGVVVVAALTLVLLVFRYNSVGNSPQSSQSAASAAAYDFFNNNNNNPPPPQIDVAKALNFKGKPSFVPELHGLSFLYSSLGNFTSLLVWARMRFLLSRSDALPGTAQGIQDAAAALKELLSTLEVEASIHRNPSQNCPYYVSSSPFNGTPATLQIPCGLVEDSSVTVIGIPDPKRDCFEIDLVGSDEANPPLVLRYKVLLPGENLTKDPFVIQNAWTHVSGWGKDQRCPDRGASADALKVDGLVKCNAQIVRASTPQNNFTNVSDVGHRGNANFPFPFVQGIPFTASLWAGAEGFHMTVNGRHETSFAYREKLEPWLVNGVEVKGGLKTIAILAKGLPVSDDMNLEFDVELLKAPPVSRKRLVLLIGVFSTANNFQRRMALRRSWMQYEAVRRGLVAVRFFIGLHKNGLVNYELWREAQVFGDIQLMPFVDYSLLTLKTIAICILGTEILPAKHIMKTDDDAFVRIDEVLSSLKGKSSEGLVYGRISYDSSPHRDKDNKWYISEEEWPYATYPPWPHGPGYIISRDIAKFIVGGHREMELMLFKLEDVAVGIWIELYKRSTSGRKGKEVSMADDERFHIGGCEPNYILAHYQSPRMVLCLWEKLQKGHRRPDCCE